MTLLASGAAAARETHGITCYRRRVSDAPRHRDGTPPRYAPARPLPARAFIPGVSPSSDRPAEATPPTAAGDDLATDETFRFGLDLYNHGFPWEAHEAWEALWRSAPHGAPARQLLQGLILIAAAAVKARGGQPTGARKLATHAAELLDSVGVLAGIHGPALATALGRWCDHVEHGAAPPPLVLT
jgi:uncharacterized protein